MLAKELTDDDLLKLFWWDQEIPEGGHQRPGSKKEPEPILPDRKYFDFDPLLA